jgi:pimeloyl-ACP methyl ester carboxylesterase
MPGHGDTAATRAADYTVDGMVAFLAAFVAAIGLNHPFVLAGHSMGGHVCWRYALKYPEHLAGLILMAAGGLANPAGGAQKAMSLARSRSGSLLLRLMSSRTRLEAGLKANVADPSVMTREMVDEWWSHSRREGVFGATLARYRAARANPAMLARLGEIETPALIQWGRQDNVFPLALGEFMANEIPNAQLVTYEPCRHFPMLEHPQETARDADAFMRRLSSGDAALGTKASI